MLQYTTSPSFSFHPPASARASTASATATSKIPTHAAHAVTQTYPFQPPASARASATATSKIPTHTTAGNITNLFLSPTCFCTCLYRLCYCNVKNTYTHYSNITNLFLSPTCFCTCLYRLCYCNIKDTHTHYSRQHHQAFPFTHLLLRVPLLPLLLQRQKYLHTLQQAISPICSFHPPASARASAASAAARARATLASALALAAWVVECALKHVKHYMCLPR